MGSDNDSFDFNWENQKVLRNLRDSFSKHADASHKIATEVLSKKMESNVVCSPLSIQVLLSLIAAGSSGPTLDQLLSFLQSSSVDEINKLSSLLLSVVMADGSISGGPEISLATGAWIDQSMSFNRSFKQVVDEVYNAGCFQVDFQSKPEEVVTMVNSWAKEKSNGLIENVISRGSLHIEARLIFANCLYFKAGWENEFNEEKTKDDYFHLLDGSSVKVPFMTHSGLQYISVNDGFKVLELPYREGYDMRPFSMYIFLPDARDGLPALVKRMGTETDFLSSHLPRQQMKVKRFMIPKFKISFTLNVSETLKALGVSSLFKGGGLTQMTESEGLFVSKIIQKSFVEVNEKGTEAAAICIDECSGSSMFEPEYEVVDFVADHPFMFLIQENISRCVMFVGQVMNPTIDN